MKKNKLIRLVIVEDVKEVRDGLKYLLSLDKEIKVVQTYKDAEELLKDLSIMTTPDVILMDIGLPRMSGIKATSLIKEKYPEVNVLILTIFEEEEKILSAVKAGATGYILKNMEPGELIRQIKSLHKGGSPISPNVARKILQEFQKESYRASETDYHLTPREKEILKDIVEGYTYTQIAANRFIASSTVKKHILHIYQKLDVTSKVEFVKKVINEKLIE
jgi:DNA-binding NarL/FixJ family response regulator